MPVRAQVPDGFGFQAVVRDNQGQLASNKVVNIRISILQGSENGNGIYAENHSVRANTQGLVSLTVGGGSGTSGEFSAIDWSRGPYFLKVEADAEGGMDYQLVATTQLMAVPYALHARSSETLDGTVSFGQITDVPDTLGFGGSWNDLTDRPELFSGQWEDLQGKPEGLEHVFSGQYADLQGKPSFPDSVARYGFSGQWEDLQGVPSSFGGSYSDLQDKPSFPDSVARYGFGGRYADLRQKPAFTRDSVPVWNTLLDYRLLQNRPDLSTGGFDGDYNNLFNTPDIPALAGERTQRMLDTLHYSSLDGLPSFRDSVEKYGFSGRYSDLSGSPDLDALIVTDYGQLQNRPNLQDTVLKYAPRQDSVKGVSSWNDLTDKPVFRDSVERYGFSGDYSDLDGRPQGQAEGDLLYWNATASSWEVLSIGEEGQMLTVAGGRLAWIDPSFVSTAANTYKVGEIYEVAGKPEGIVVEVSSTGRYALIASLDEYDASYSTVQSLIGATNREDGQANTNLVKSISGWESTYPAFSALGDGWYLPSVSEIRMLYETRVAANSRLEGISGAEPVSEPLYWSSTEFDASSALAFLFTDTTIKTGDEIDSMIYLTGGQEFETTKDGVFAIRAFKRLSWSEATSKPDNGRLYRVGDIYVDPRTSMPEGVVYKVTDGGLHGYVLSYQETDTTYEAALSWPGEGWRLPDAEEMMDILQQRYVINASMDNYLQNTIGKVKLDDAPYAEGNGLRYMAESAGDAGEGLATVLYFGADGDLLQSDLPATETARVRKIKAF